MTRGRAGIVAALTVVAALLVWLLFVGLPRWYSRVTPTAATAPSAEAAGDGRKINVRLFYVADDGTSLTSVEQEVAYAERTLDQARAILLAQLAPAGEAQVSAVPPGTTLRALFITDRGEAYADFSRELVSAHPGGSMNEMLTVYTLVDALTANLPAISSVQILVDGKELDTLAGHLDLRRPLVRRTS